MLSRKLLSTFFNARSAAYRNDESDKKLPSALYPYRGAFGSLSEPTIRCVGPQRPPLVEQISMSSIQTALQDETPREQLKLSKEMEDGLRHIHLLGEIKKRREVARMKYQEILLKQCSSSVCSTDSHVSSGDSTLSSRSVAKVRRRRRRRLRRQVSEIDDRDDMQLLEAETFSFAVSGTSTSPASTSPTKKIPRAYGSSLSLETMETTTSDESGTSKKKPHIKKYAQEYNMLVTAVSKFFIKNKHSGPERDSNYKGSSVIKYGTLRKISHIDVGIGTDVFCELRPGMVTFYNKFDGDDTSVDVKSMHVRKGECTCMPTKYLAKAPFPMWDAVFEVSINDKPPQFFMAESPTDRQGWLTAFDAAISLQQDPSSDTLEDREEGSSARLAYEGEENIIGHNADILLYLHVRGLLQAASSREEYMESISILRGKTISVPAHWLKEYFEDSPVLNSGNNDIPVEWARLGQELFSINGHIVRGGMDSVVGSLKSHILDLDICSSCVHQPKIKESQAIFFARDILLSFDREQSENQAIYCTSKMLGNDLLVSIARGSDGMEPVKVQLRSIHGHCRSKQIQISGKEDAQEEREDSCEYTVEVTLRAPNIYRICSSDPLNSEETWSLMRTNYIQKFVLSPDSLRRMNQFVQFDIVPYQ